MADISVFPNITTPLVAGDNIKSLRAGATIKPGQVVEISDSRTVVPATGTGTPIGVAIGNAVLGEQVAVAGNGCWVSAGPLVLWTVEKGSPSPSTT